MHIRTILVSLVLALSVAGAQTTTDNFSTGPFVQKDPGVRGGIQNTGGGLQQQGIPIPHPPLISPNPTTGATVNDNERASFEEGILRAGQLESTCDDCAGMAWARGITPTSALSATRNPRSVDPAASSFPIPVIRPPSRRRIRSSGWSRTVMGGRTQSRALSTNSALSGKCDSSSNPTAHPMAVSINCGQYAAVRTIPPFPTALLPNLTSQRKLRLAISLSALPCRCWDWA